MPVLPLSRVRRAAVAMAAAILAACSLGRTPPPPRPLTAAEAARAEWPRELALVQAAAMRNDHPLADSVLRGFSARYPGTEEAADALFWRALLRLDPAAARDAAHDPVREAATILDAYLAGGVAQPRYVEAATLRRLASLLDSLRVAAGGQRGMPSAAALRDTVKARDDELAKLRQELQQTTAELERIRRRLAPKRP